MRPVPHSSSHFTGTYASREAYMLVMSDVAIESQAEGVDRRPVNPKQTFSVPPRLSSELTHPLRAPKTTYLPLATF